MATGHLFAVLISAAAQLYGTLIFVYILSTWLPVRGTLADIQRVLGSLCEPYLALFRRFIPPFGAIDFSPVVALLVLELVSSLLVRVVSSL